MFWPGSINKSHKLTFSTKTMQASQIALLVFALLGACKGNIKIFLKAQIDLAQLSVESEYSCSTSIVQCRSYCLGLPRSNILQVGGVSAKPRHHCYIGTVDVDQPPSGKPLDIYQQVDPSDSGKIIGIEKLQFIKLHLIRPSLLRGVSSTKNNLTI